MDELIEAVIKAAEDFKRKPIPLASKRRVRKLLRKLVGVQEQFDFAGAANDSPHI